MLALCVFVRRMDLLSRKGSSELFGSRLAACRGIVCTRWEAQRLAANELLNKGLLIIGRQVFRKSDANCGAVKTLFDVKTQAES